LLSIVTAISSPFRPLTGSAVQIGTPRFYTSWFLGPQGIA
jgi:hypothetical protein